MFNNNFADPSNTWYRLLFMVTPAYHARPHRSSKIAQLEWVMPLRVEILSPPPGRVKANNQPKGRPAERLHLACLANHSHLKASAIQL